MTTATMERTWTTVGAEFVEMLGQRSVEHEIEALEWIEIPEHGEGPQVGFSPGHAIKATILDLRIPKVDAIAISSFDRPATDAEQDGFYPGFYGIQGHYQNGRARVFVLDTGTTITPLCSDFYPLTAAEAAELAEDAEGHIQAATTQEERERWQRKAHYYWGLA